MMPSHSCCTSSHSVSIASQRLLEEFDLEALQLVVGVDEIERRIGAFHGDPDHRLRLRGSLPGLERQTRLTRASPLRGWPAFDRRGEHLYAWTGLTAGNAHMTAQRGAGVAAVDDEVVALGLAGDRSTMACREQFVASEARKRRAQIGGVLLAEAHVERAGAGEPHAVAAFAEIMGHRRDEAEPAAGLLHAHIAGRAAGAVVEVLERVARRQPRPHQRQRQILVDARRRRSRRAA